MCLWQSFDVEANLAITRYLDIQIQPILPGGATCIAKLAGINLTPDGRIELASSSTRVISVESTKGVPGSRSCPWSSLHCSVLWCTTIDMAETQTFFIFTQITRCVNSLCHCVKAPPTLTPLPSSCWVTAEEAGAEKHRSAGLKSSWHTLWPIPSTPLVILETTNLCSRSVGRSAQRCQTKISVSLLV